MPNKLTIKFSLILASLLALPTAQAGNLPELFGPQPAARGASTAKAAAAPPAAQAVKFNAEALLGLPEGGEAQACLPRLGCFTIVHDRNERQPGGDTTWIGYFKGYGTDYRIFITVGAYGASGLIVSPDGEFSLTPGGDQEWLRDQKQAGFQPVAPSADDTRAQPKAALAASGASFAADFAAASENSTIDLMLVYTPGMAQRYGAGLSARLNNLVAIANQAYIDSGVGITLRLVGTVEIDYSETTSINTALDDLSDGIGPFAGVAALRRQYGADLVQLIRPYRGSVAGCGLAWIGSAQPLPQYGYSVSADGPDAEGSNTYCYDISLAHELGHNMGAAHDRAHANAPGAYDYSYGYGFDGKFATIMAAGYIDAKPVAKFSSPNLDCGGSPCGVAANLPNAADNAQTLNNTRAAIAWFAGASPTECLLNWAEASYPGLFSPPGAASQYLSSYTYRYYAATQAYLGVSATDSHAYYLGPDGALRDEGALSIWLPLAGCQ